MNLWIFLAIIWIGTSTVIADPGWFVQDLPLHGDEGDDLFSNEHLLPVQKLKPKPKPLTQAKKPDTNKHVQPKPAPAHTSSKRDPVPEAKTDIFEIERENLIPVERIGRRPLQVGERQTPSQGQQQQQQTQTAHQPPTPRIESNEEDVSPCTKDIDCLMEEEGLMLVSKGDKKKTPATPLILHNKVAANPALPGQGQDAVKDAGKKDKDEPKSKREQLDKSSLHRRLMKLDSKPTEDVMLRTQTPLLQPLLDDDVVEEIQEEEEEEEEEELPFEVTNDEIEAHGIIARYKRQAANTDTESSGDFAGSFDETQNTTSDPLYEIPFSTTFHTPLPAGTELTADLIANITTQIENQMADNYENITDVYKGVSIRNISLDQNNRIVVDYTILLRPAGAPGQSPEQRNQNTLNLLTNVIVPGINDLNIDTDPVYNQSRLDPDVTRNIVDGLLGDACQSVNACPEGYACRNPSTGAFCRHRCYDSGLIDQCQNGGQCQLDYDWQPYCMCGENFVGALCETEIAPETSYTSGEIIGATAGATVAATGMVSSVVYLALYRKKKEEDMDYSYFGDDSSNHAAFEDVNASLNSYHIARPSLNIQSNDLYNQTA